MSDNPLSVSDTPINISREWHVRTPDFEMYFMGKTHDECYRFMVITNRNYPSGRRYQEYILTKELVSEPESNLIKLLSKMMQAEIDYLIASGELK